VSYEAENSSVFRHVLKVVMVAELFVATDREFHTAGAMMLNALDWKLIQPHKASFLSNQQLVYFGLIYGGERRNRTKNFPSDVSRNVHKNTDS